MRDSLTLATGLVKRKADVAEVPIPLKLNFLRLLSEI
jgi:hypothetical protein